MSKKFLSIIGVLLLLAAFVFGIYTFIQRHRNDELFKNPFPRSSKKITKEPAFNKKLYSISDPTSQWVIVNKKLPLNPIKYEPSDLMVVGNNQQLKTPAAEALLRLLKDSESSGLSIIVVSGYRSYSFQEEVYGLEVADSSLDIASKSSAMPGYSEHQTGWAIDLGSRECNTDDYDCFGTTAEATWVALNAYRYGYIVRYTDEKQAVTGYRGEPWHIRYVGTELSKEMHKEKVVTLEEFFEL